MSVNVLGRRFALLLALIPAVGLAALKPVAEPQPTPGQTSTYHGKVVPLADVMKQLGSPLDVDAAPHWLALVAEDGTIHPLLKDVGSRLFFQDERLRQRSMRLTGRLVGKTGMLQVLAVHSVVGGEVREVYYWCDICSIRVGEKKICECCGEPMYLKEVPVRK